MQTITITGNIGKDAETATRKDGSQYLTFRVAADEGRDKAPTWYGVALYVSNPANLQQYLVKGARVLINGRLIAGAYTDSQGVAQPALSIATSGSGIEIIKFAGQDQNNSL